jgi:uncharacterized protein YuzE
MKFEYDPDVDGLYIWFVKDIEKEGVNYESEVWPAELKNEIGMLFDKKGKLMGLEILPASKYFDAEMLNDADNEPK